MRYYTIIVASLSMVTMVSVAEVNNQQSCDHGEHHHYYKDHLAQEWGMDHDQGHHDMDKLLNLTDAQKKNVVVDLSGVDIMNSSGLGMLIKGASTMKNAGGGLKIARASEKILELIKITKLTGILPTYNTVAEAAASFKK